MKYRVVVKPAVALNWYALQERRLSIFGWRWVQIDSGYNKEDLIEAGKLLASGNLVMWSSAP